MGNTAATSQDLTSNGFKTAASVTPARVASGGTVTVTASVTAQRSKTVLVDVEVYAPDGTQVAQSFWDLQSLAANVARKYTLTWTAPADAARGAYTVQIGIFQPNWASTLHWNDSAGGFQVTTAAPPPPPPAPDAGVPSPTCNPQATWRPSSGFQPLSDAQARARICPQPETRPLNAPANAYVPTAAELSAFLAAKDQTGQPNAASNPYVTFVTGGCGGAGRTTDEVIQCNAAKWGIPADWLRAEFVEESYWQHVDPATGHPAMGDKTFVGATIALQYPDFSRELDSGGQPTGYVWQSLGLTQVRWTPDGSVGTGTEPLRWKSSAFNADYQGSVVRFYFDNPQGLRSSWGDSTYGAGEDWWSIGGWFNPYPWQNAGQQGYITAVQDHLAKRVWAQPGF